MKFKIAEEEDLYRNLQEAVNEDEALPKHMRIGDILDTWINQAGYPLLTVTRNYQSNEIVVNQQRFLSSPEEADTDGLSWYIPLTISTASSPNTAETKPWKWLESGTRELVLTATENKTWTSEEWVLFNVQQSGYYRVNYDAQNWRLLANELNQGSPFAISTINRAQIIDDSFNLAYSDIVPFTLALEIIKYIRFEPDYAVWISANRHLLTLNRRLDGPSYELYFGRFLKHLTEDHFEKLDVFENINGKDTNRNTFLRPIIVDLACRSGSGMCLTATRIMVTAEALTGHRLTPNEKPAVYYCHGLRNADAKTFNYFWTKLKTIKNEQERSHIATSLRMRELVIRTTENQTWTSDDWVLFNMEQTGYYRVNYDRDNWKLLADELHRGSPYSIGMLNRAQLIDDAFNLAYSDIIQFTVALDLIKYLKYEKEYAVWITANRHLLNMIRKLEGPSYELYFGRSSGQGFCHTRYISEDGEVYITATSLLYMTYARMVFPCYDEPRYRTPFTIHLTHHPSLTAASNMPVTTISNNSKCLLYNEYHTTPTQKMDIARTICHLLTHNYFGNIVGMSWWSYAWMTEGFAYYYEYYFTSFYLTDFPLEEIFVVNMIQRFFADNSRLISKPLSNYVEARNDVINIFNFAMVTKAGGIRFLSSREQEDPESLSWYIPLSMSTANNPDMEDTKPVVWLKKGMRELVIRTTENKSWTSDDWVLFNTQQTGYYRVNYDTENWKLLAEDLHRGHPYRIGTLNRAQLIDDSFNLAYSDIVEFTVALDIIKYIKYDEEYAVWVSANRHLLNMIRKLDGPSYELYFGRFLRHLTEDHFAKLDVFENTHGKDSVTNTFLRPIIVDLACYSRSRMCQTATRTMVTAEALTGYVLVPHEKPSVYYCHGLKNADENTFQYFWKRLKNLTNQQERAHIVHSIGCYHNTESFYSLLLETVDPIESLGYTIIEKFQMLVYASIPRGFCYTRYVDESGDISYVATSFLHVTNARMAFPCYDEPRYRTPFKIHITHHASMMAASNMPVESISNSSDGNVMTSFQESVAMSVNLVAFTVCNYASRKFLIEEKNLEIGFLVPKHAINQVDFAMDFIISTLNKLEEYIGIGYNLPKLESVVVNDLMHNGLENWGLMVYE
uniref:Aminopeptidase n=1 Tax=Lutzomyia longipalpis TaxID=7200 RepID=A0A1B0CGD7_LUTLO